MSYPIERLNIRPSVLVRGLAAAASLKAVVLQWRQRYRSRQDLARLTVRDQKPF
jgi:uncharacterized protein YjiS (DUF1127 family)